jgi:hypothetical protein
MAEDRYRCLLNLGPGTLKPMSVDVLRCPTKSNVQTRPQRLPRSRCAPWAWVDRWLEPQPGERL